jgi:hypothetical protein
MACTTWTVATSYPQHDATSRSFATHVAPHVTSCTQKKKKKNLKGWMFGEGEVGSGAITPKIYLRGGGQTTPTLLVFHFLTTKKRKNGMTWHISCLCS